MLSLLAIQTEMSHRQLNRSLELRRKKGIISIHMECKAIPSDEIISGKRMTVEKD